VPGNVLLVDLGANRYAFGRVCPSTIAFYDLKVREVPPLDEIIVRPLLFNIWVVDYAITEGDWPVIGHVPLEQELLVEPLFFKRDPITKTLTIYRDSTGEEIPAIKAECEALECAAVWEPEHVVDRLNDHFTGKPNKWVQSLKGEI